MFSILVDISASTSKLESGIDQAVRKIGSLESAVTRTGKAIAGAFGIGLGIDEFVSSMNRAINTGAGLELLAQRLGTNAKSLSQLQYAAQLTDVPLEALSVAFDHFHEVTTRAEIGGGRAAKTFAAIGVDAKKLLALPFDQQFSAIADKLAGIENPARRAGIEMVLFGETGAKLDPLLRQGSAGIDRLRAAAEAAGVTFDDKMGPALLHTKEALEQADAQIDAASQRLAIVLSPAITGAISKFTAFISVLGRAGSGLAEFIGGAAPGANALGQLEDALKSLEATHSRLVTEIAEAEAEKDPQTGALAGIMPISEQDLKKKKDLADEYVRLIANMKRQIHEALLRDRFLGAPEKTKTPIDIASAFDPNKLLIQVNAQKIYGDKMVALYEEFNKNTETSTEKTVADFNWQEAQLQELRAAGLIDQAEYTTRLNELLDKVLPGVDVSDKLKIKQPVKEQLDDMVQLGDKAAASMQSAFADFLFNPFHDGARKMGLDFLQALHKMTADAAAAKIFKGLFGDNEDEGGKKGAAGSSGLGGILGDALGKLFEGGAVSTGGGPNLFQKALGSASGAIGGGIGKWLAGLMGGGGSGLANLASSGANAAIAAGDASIGADLATSIASMAVPGLAEGGLVSAGSSYLVGEEGPELFTAASHGMITPNDQLTSSGDTHVHMGDTHIDARGADADRVMQMVPPLIAAANAQMAAKMLIAFRRNGLAAPPRV